MANAGYPVPRLGPKQDAHIKASVARSVYIETMTKFCSGVIMQTNLVFTNWHIIEGLSMETPAGLWINRKPARVIHFDISKDLLALHVRTRKTKPVELSTKIRKLMTVFYVGNPQNWRGAVTPGLVVWHDRKRIATNAVPGDGCSGSGLYDLETGGLVGIMDAGIGPRNDIYGLAIPTASISEFYRTALWKMERLMQIEGKKKEVLEEQGSFSWG